MEHKRSNKTKTAPAQNIQPGAPPIMRPQSRPAPSISAPNASQTLRNPAHRPFHFIFESKFKARKTPLSHGFTGLAAIKAGAKKTAIPGAQQRQKTLRNLALNRLRKRSLRSMRRSPGKAKRGSLRKQERMSKLPKAD